jgi:hypothetical protein
MINQIDLAAQFDKIFTSDEVHEFYHEWKNEKDKANKKLKTLKDKLLDTVPFLLIILAVGGACLWVYHINNRVEQSTMKMYDGEVDFITDVWVDGEIAKQWSMPAEKVTDSIRTAQYNEAEKLFKLLEK